MHDGQNLSKSIYPRICLLVKWVLCAASIQNSQHFKGWWLGFIIFFSIFYPPPPSAWLKPFSAPPLFFGTGVFCPSPSRLEAPQPLPCH